MISRSGLIEEYNNYYRMDPTKWTGNRRNRFAGNVTRELIKKPKNILDVGCGNGHTLKYFKRVYPGTKLYGLDLSPVACKIASDNVSGATIVEGFIEDFDLGCQFDLILCMGVAEHFLNIEAGLRSIKNLLSKRGVLYLEIPNCLSYDPGDEGYRRLSVGSHQMEWHLKRETWETIIHKCGFEIVQSFTGERASWEFVWGLK